MYEHGCSHPCQNLGKADLVVITGRVGTLAQPRAWRWRRRRRAKPKNGIAESHRCSNLVSPPQRGQRFGNRPIIGLRICVAGLDIVLGLAVLLLLTSESVQLAHDTSIRRKRNKLEKQQSHRAHLELTRMPGVVPLTRYTILPRQ